MPPKKKKIAPKKKRKTPKKKTLGKKSKVKQRRYVPASKPGDSPLIIEPPQEYSAIQPSQPGGGSRLLVTLAALGIILALVYQARRTKTEVQPQTYKQAGQALARRPLPPQARPQVPPTQHRRQRFNTKPFTRNRLQPKVEIDSQKNKPVTRREPSQETDIQALVKPHLPAAAPALPKKPMPEATRSEPFKNPVKVKVKAKDEAAILRVFSDKPRKLIFQIQRDAGTGKGVLEWRGTDLENKPVAPGLYYLSVSDANGTRNDELWVR